MALAVPALASPYRCNPRTLYNPRQKHFPHITLNADLRRRLTAFSTRILNSQGHLDSTQDLLTIEVRRYLSQILAKQSKDIFMLFLRYTRPLLQFNTSLERLARAQVNVGAFSRRKPKFLLVGNPLEKMTVLNQIIKYRKGFWTKKNRTFNMHVSTNNPDNRILVKLNGAMHHFSLFTTVLGSPKGKFRAFTYADLQTVDNPATRIFTRHLGALEVHRQPSFLFNIAYKDGLRRSECINVRRQYSENPGVELQSQNMLSSRNAIIKACSSFDWLWKGFKEFRNRPIGTRISSQRFGTQVDVDIRTTSGMILYALAKEWSKRNRSSLQEHLVRVICPWTGPFISRRLNAWALAQFRNGKPVRMPRDETSRRIYRTLQYSAFLLSFREISTSAQSSYSDSTLRRRLRDLQDREEFQIECDDSEKAYYYSIRSR